MTAPHTKSSSGCGVCGESNLAKYKCPKCRLPYCSVKCCKDHKVTCPAVQTNADTVNQTSIRINRNNSITDPNNTRAVSKYLAADELTQDPLLNSAKRKQMLRENEDDDDPEDEGWHITQEMMNNVDNSEWLRKELADGGLRQIIMQIDNADEEMNQNRHGHGQQQRKRKRFQSGAKAYEYDPSPRELELMKAKRLNPKFSNFIDRLLLIAGVLVESEKKTVEQEVATYLNAHGDEDGAPSTMGVLSLAPIVKMKACKAEIKTSEKLNEEESFSESADEDDESSSSSSSSSYLCSH